MVIEGTSRPTPPKSKPAPAPKKESEAAAAPTDSEEAPRPSTRPQAPSAAEEEADALYDDDEFFSPSTLADEVGEVEIFRASSLRTEDKDDGEINCLDLVGDHLDELQEDEETDISETEVYFLEEDDNETGHVVVELEDGTVWDPANPEAEAVNLEEYLEAHPDYQPIASAGGDQVDEILEAAVGTDDRDDAIERAGLTPIADDLFADGPTPEQLNTLAAAGADQVPSFVGADGGPLDGSGTQIYAIDIAEPHFDLGFSILPHLAPGATAERRIHDPLSTVAFQLLGDTNANQRLTQMEWAMNDAQSGDVVTTGESFHDGFTFPGDADRLFQMAQQANDKGVTLLLPVAVAGFPDQENYPQAEQLYQQLQQQGVVIVGAGDYANYGEHNTTVNVNIAHQSNAVPIVAATIALMRDGNPNQTNQQIAAALAQGGASGFLDIPTALMAAGIPQG